MPVRTAEAEWKGNLLEGQGHMKLGAGAYDGPYSFKSRMETGPGTNPEELIGAAHAGCFSMALSAELGKAGFAPKRVHTTAGVQFDKVDGGFAITRIDLTIESVVHGIEISMLQELAVHDMTGCHVS